MTNVFIYDNFDPETNAMLQALYSRSSGSVTEHINKAMTAGSKKFMESYYVGYGHSSIGDCGVTTLFIEGVSILAAKAIQDHPLYSGQETSTRYIDFSKQERIDPIGSKLSNEIISNWFSFYEKNHNLVNQHIKNNHPLKNNESSKTWEKAVSARTFDILRSFIPNAASTQLSWTTNLRQAHEKLFQLKHHPLEEIQNIADRCLAELKQKYPSSFSHADNNLVNPYMMYISNKLHYSDYNWPKDKSLEEILYTSSINNTELEKHEFDTINKRQPKLNLPRYISKYGRYECQFIIDFGSYRDIQRHRNGLCRIPVVKTELGFNNWYIEQLPEELKHEAKILISKQLEKIEQLRVSENINVYDLQYFLPMGMNVVCEVIYDLPEMVYVTELRSGKTVHPTLRHIAHKLYSILKENHPNLALYVDTDLDDFTIKRGTQDIYKK